jgi:hypothetical protein
MSELGEQLKQVIEKAQEPKREINCESEPKRDPRIYYADTGLYYTPSTRAGFYQTMDLFCSRLLELGVPDQLDKNKFIKESKGQGNFIPSLYYLLVRRYNEKSLAFDFTQFE